MSKLIYTKNDNTIEISEQDLTPYRKATDQDVIDAAQDARIDEAMQAGGTVQSVNKVAPINKDVTIDVKTTQAEYDQLTMAEKKGKTFWIDNGEVTNDASYAPTLTTSVNTKEAVMALMRPFYYVNDGTNLGCPTQYGFLQIVRSQRPEDDYLPLIMLFYPSQSAVTSIYKCWVNASSTSNTWIQVGGGSNALNTSSEV